MFFTRLYVEQEDDDTPGVTGNQLTDYVSPFVEIHRTRTGARHANGAAARNDSAEDVNRAILLATALGRECSSKTAMVDPRGFEPLTPSMRTRCATGLRHGPILLTRLLVGLRDVDEVITAAGRGRNRLVARQAAWGRGARRRRGGGVGATGPPGHRATGEDDATGRGCGPWPVASCFCACLLGRAGCLSSLGPLAL